jgi:hypothetical protein
MGIQQAVQLTAKMCDVRDACRRIYGDKYAAKMDEATKAMTAICGAFDLRPIQFLPWLSRKMKADGKEIGEGDILVFTAATVELIEGDKDADA